MYSIAKAKAISKGLTGAMRGDKVLGFGLTYGELERIYAQEGYSIRHGSKDKDNVINAHIYNWTLAKLIERVGDTIFFTFDPEDLRDMETYAYLNEYRREHPDLKCDYIGIAPSILDEVSQ